MRPWRPCPEDQKWLAMCARFRDRFPTSVLWPGHLAVYRGIDQGGMIVRAAGARVRCSYNADGTTMSKKGSPCAEWCTDPGAKWWRCSWPPDALKRMLEAQDTTSYNEVVLESSFWLDHLPDTVEAFFAVRWPDEMLGPPHDFNPPDKQNVLQARRDYLQEYHLASEDVPLLLYDAARSPPFVLYPHSEW